MFNSVSGGVPRSPLYSYLACLARVAVYKRKIRIATSKANLKTKPRTTRGAYACSPPRRANSQLKGARRLISSRVARAKSRRAPRVRSRASWRGREPKSRRATRSSVWTPKRRSSKSKTPAPPCRPPASTCRALRIRRRKIPSRRELRWTRRGPTWSWRGSSTRRVSSSSVRAASRRRSSRSLRRSWSSRSPPSSKPRQAWRS